MPKFKEIYVDGIEHVHFSGNMVRLDFFTLQAPAQEGSQEPSTEVVERIIMNPTGFLSAFTAMQKIADKLVDAGVLQKNT